MDGVLFANDMTFSGLLEGTQAEGWRPALRGARPSRRIYIGQIDATSATLATADAYAEVAPAPSLDQSTGPHYEEQWKIEVVDDPLDDLKQLIGKSQVHDLRGKIMDALGAVNLPPTAERYRRAIQILLEAGMLNDVKAITDEALRAFPIDHSLNRYKKIMAPPKFALTPSSAISQRIKSDSEWLTANKDKYSGLWVILLSGNLIDSGPSLDEIWKRSGAKVKGQRPLVTLIESEVSDAASA